jgi:hypothetical protein
VIIVPQETRVQETRVRELEDRQAITDVLFRVAAGIGLADAGLHASSCACGSRAEAPVDGQRMIWHHRPPGLRCGPAADRREGSVSESGVLR